MKMRPGMKILVIDDMATIRQILKKMLREIGCTNIHEADDASVALPMIQAAHGTDEPFEFIISDWNMPIMTGLELIKTLRADERFTTLPFLMVTAEAEQSNVVVAIKAGVSNFIVKPFSASTFKEKLDKIFKD